jgi:hypothetical protein
MGLQLERRACRGDKPAMLRFTITLIAANSRRPMPDMGGPSHGVPHPQPTTDPVAGPWDRPELF